MTIKIHNNSFINCGTGVSAPKSADLEASGNHFVRVGKAFDIRSDHEDLVDALNLPKDTPPEYIQEAIAVVQSRMHGSVSSQERFLSKTRLVGWLDSSTKVAVLLNSIKSLFG